MRLQPANVPELQAALADANARGVKVETIDLRALNRALEYTPEDLTITVEAGMTLTELQALLRERGQWLPVDPPEPDRLTINGLLAANVSGPRRFGYDTVRDCVIGAKAVLPDGRLIKSGGKVVKNVAGYDLCRLWIGSHGSLGVLVEATFKLRPLPEAERFTRLAVDSPEHAGERIAAILDSPLAPTVLDLHNLPLEVGGVYAGASEPTSLTLVLGFSGTREEVEWQLATTQALGISEAANLDYETAFWAGATSQDQSPIRRVSVLPSKLPEAIRALGAVPFVSRAGNGVIFYRGAAPAACPARAAKLMRRVKDEYDPKHILPELPP